MPDIDINPQFQQALDLLEQRVLPTFITGCAGTGKSTLLRHFCSLHSKDVVVLAPTAVAALNVRGHTIHHFFQFGINVTPEQIRETRRKPRNPDLYHMLTTVIIDEASMLRADLLDCVDLFLKKHGPIPGKAFGGVQMIFFGDLYQLPPIVRSNERDIFKSLYTSPYFFSAHAMQGVALEIMELTEVYRQQDPKFVELLGRIRTNTLNDQDLPQLNERVIPDFQPSEQTPCIRLTPTNKAADAINENKLDQLDDPLQISQASITGNFKRSYPTAEALHFKKGARVMLLTNDFAKRWVNGSLGDITRIQKDEDEDGHYLISIRLLDNNKVIQVKRHSWDIYRYTLKNGHIVSEVIGQFVQYPFRLAWAVTIHKSQGQTFDHLILDIGHGAFSPGQTYVALSRCTTLEGLVLTRPIHSSSIRVDQQIPQFLATHLRDKGDLQP